MCIGDSRWGGTGDIDGSPPAPCDAHPPVARAVAASKPIANVRRDGWLVVGWLGWCR